jgi:uncharacterized protein (UPF0333 family)
MIKHNRKGAIELSVNFIIVIILSIVVLVSGLTLFFRMMSDVQTTVGTLDIQTKANIKNMMLSNNYRTAVYPTDEEIPNNDAQLFGVGITNIYDEKTNFTIMLSSVKYYARTAVGELKNPVSNYYNITSGGKVEVAPHDQVVKEILLKMPKGSLKGQYVYTISVVNGTNSYGTLQVYIINK